ncbi:hypothetical protein BB561_002546 [Smittium simulii]|uniref:Uncharacterized protein n=1 Tax=Smittium simulii TaxID=133385 RepID=A0A2T9YQ18_9FUNG|nr:hypothetical protein BB561_002546 [Smittium simulii]
MELETEKFMYGIRVARTLILNGIKFSPIPLNRCPNHQIRKKIILEEIRNEIASQVKAIKDSTKPNKLQSLELNTKKNKLISRENIDYFTEFNSII